MTSTSAPRTRGRRALAVGSVAALLGGSLLLAQAPAQAAPATVDDATFVWGLNGYAQKGIFGPWIFKNLDGNVTQLVGSVSGGSQTEYVVDPVPATSMPASTPQKTPNAIKFTDGTGTVDAATGAAELSWTGTYTVNAYPAGFGAPDEIYKDPELSVAADGSGELRMDVTIGAGTDMSGNPSPEAPLGELVLARFGPGALSNVTDHGFRVTPSYQGVTIDGLPGSAQVRTCGTDGGATGWWGSWPAEFVSAIPDAIQPHFYSTGCGGMQDNKPALPFDVGFTAPTGEPEPEPDADQQNIQVTVPEQAPEPGEFIWSIDGSNDLVDLGTAVKQGDRFVADGEINPVRVTDTRLGGHAWSISGQVQDFAADGQTIDGKYLGWTPTVTENDGGAVAGDSVASGIEAGNGLADSATLGSAEDGHTLGSSLLGADLDLQLPLSATEGTYQATLTLTALS